MIKIPLDALVNKCSLVRYVRGTTISPTIDFTHHQGFTSAVRIFWKSASGCDRLVVLQGFLEIWRISDFFFLFEDMVTLFMTNEVKFNNVSQVLSSWITERIIGTPYLADMIQYQLNSGPSYCMMFMYWLIPHTIIIPIIFDIYLNWVPPRTTYLCLRITLS